MWRSAAHQTGKLPGMPNVLDSVAEKWEVPSCNSFFKMRALISRGCWVVSQMNIYIYYLSLLLQSFTQCRTCHSGHFFELNGCQESANLRTAELLRSFSEAVEVGIVMDPEPKDVWWHQNLACFSCTFLYLFAFFGFNSCVAAIGFHDFFILQLITSNDTRWFLCWDPHGSIESCSREPPSRGAAIDLHDTYSYVHVYNMYTYIRHMPLMCGSRVT